jgi:hypothetical protein
MRPRIDRAGHDFETEALVVRTDYSDDEAWQAVVDLLNQPNDGFPVRTHVVDDPAFAGASADEVKLSTMDADAGLEVVFLADAVAMKRDHTLLAVSTRSQELEEGDLELSSEFRLLPAVVNLMHVNLAIGHQDFWEFAFEAARHPDGVYRM